MDSSRAGSRAGIRSDDGYARECLHRLRCPRNMAEADQILTDLTDRGV